MWRNACRHFPIYPFSICNLELLLFFPSNKYSEIILSFFDAPFPEYILSDFLILLCFGSSPAISSTPVMTEFPFPPASFHLPPNLLVLWYDSLTLMLEEHAHYNHVQPQQCSLHDSHSHSRFQRYVSEEQQRPCRKRTSRPCSIRTLRNSCREGEQHR